MTEANTLLTDVKNYLDITWTDTNTDNKILGIIERGMSYLNDTAGAELDYSVNKKPKELLQDYCRYVRSNALEQFQKNFMSELLTLQIKQEVIEYAETNADV
jgi:hypothetical protein